MQYIHKPINMELAEMINLSESRRIPRSKGRKSIPNHIELCFTSPHIFAVKKITTGHADMAE